MGDELAANPYMRVVTSRAACGKIAMAMYGVTGDIGIPRTCDVLAKHV